MLRVSSAGDPPLGTDADAYFHAWAVQAYETVKAECTERRGTPEQVRAAQVAMYLIAVLLLSYGHIEVVGDVLNHDFTRTLPFVTLEGCVWSLVPVPSEFYRKNALSFAWIQTNKARLHWSEEAGKFLLLV